jgi:3-deoxy-D-manno-octulosonic-acid transferase
MAWLSDIVYMFGGLVYLPVVIWQMIILKKNRRGWAERFGLGSAGANNSNDADSRRIWLHAVSLGEVNAARGIVNELQNRVDKSTQIVISTTTDTGYNRAVQLFGPQRVFRYPLDFSPVIRRVLNRIRPSLIILVELEVWPNLISLAARRRIPVAVVNGRLTERSCRRFGYLGPITKNMFKNLTWVGAQDETIAARFQSLGTPQERITITGSVKWDTAGDGTTPVGTEQLANEMQIDRANPLIVAGSTGPGEEAKILDAYATILKSHPTTQLAIIPRKPERFDEVAGLIESKGHQCIRRSIPQPKPANKPVYLGDTMGELRKFYALADVVFVGRSLVPLGGSDPMEVAALAKPIIVGPHMDNFLQPVQDLGSAGGLKSVEDTNALADLIIKCLSNEQSPSTIGLRAQREVRKQQGATLRTVQKLLKIFRGDE